MAKVLFIAVHKDVARAETLAEMFEMAGVEVISPFDDDRLDECDAAIVLWSRAAMRCPSFLRAAERAVQAGKELCACLKGAPASVLNADSAFDLTRWSGSADSDLLDDFFYAAYAKLMEARRAATIAIIADDLNHAANDNPQLQSDWRVDVWEDDAPHPAVLGVGWTAPLPNAPLATLTAKRFPARKPSVAKRFFRSAARVAVALALLSAGGFVGSLAMHDAPPQQHTDRGLPAFVTEASALDDAGVAAEDMADVAQPVWTREPASAPEMRGDRG